VIEPLAEPLWLVALCASLRALTDNLPLPSSSTSRDELPTSMEPSTVAEVAESLATSDAGIVPWPAVASNAAWILTMRLSAHAPA